MFAFACAALVDFRAAAQENYLFDSLALIGSVIENVVPRSGLLAAQTGLGIGAEVRQSFGVVKGCRPPFPNKRRTSRPTARAWA